MSVTVHNPLIWADIPDVEVLRQGEVFYMVSTTMHVLPGCPVMKSTDLVNWEIVSYVFDYIDDNDLYRLENKERNGAYGHGQWATSLRYNEGIYYACFVCNEMKKTYIYYTDDIESSNWKHHTLDGIFHDPSILFDDGHLYIFYNGGDIRVTELLPDGSGVKKDGINQLLFSTPTDNIMLRCEGCHAYKLNGFYYLIFIEWPFDGNNRRREVCYRSRKLLGPYERKIVLDDDMGYHNRGIAQGAFFDDAYGNWYAMLFQDHDAVGRIPYLMPMKWENDWPVLGDNGKVPESFELPFMPGKKYDICVSDSFNHSKNILAKQWEWNHQPDNLCWSFTQNPGFLRLTTGCIRDNVLFARNTLTQRTMGPACTASVEVNISGMKNGDYCGLIALQSNYGTVGFKMENDKKYLIMTNRTGEKYCEEFVNDSCFLRIHFDFLNSIDEAGFFYSADGKEYKEIGEKLKMQYTLDHFMGYRIGLFNYSTLETGGFADYRNFVFEK